MAFHAVKVEEFAKAKQNTSKLRLFVSVCWTCRVVVLLNKPRALLTTLLRSPSLLTPFCLRRAAGREEAKIKTQNRSLLCIYLCRYSFLSFSSLRLQNISSSRKISALCQNLTQKIVILISSLVLKNFR